MHCTIVGAGVSGLTSGIRLLENGHQAHIVSDKFSPDTVSDVAAAIWYPFLVKPADRADTWGIVTYDVLESLCESDPEAGVRMIDGREYLRSVVDLPQWNEDIAAFRILESEEIPDGYVFGWEFRAPAIDMKLYMPWLKNRFEELGGTFERGVVKSLKEVDGEIIVNCVGLGARELCDDEEVKPARGQIIFIEQDPGIGHFDQQPETLTYTIPRTNVTVLGGTAQVDDWDLEIREEDNDLILAKVEAIWPDLDRSKIVGGTVGLRPSRTEVRLEEEEIGGVRVIHNYGHGGAGVTLSWGCADEVVSIAQGS
ncbi:MAG: amino acid oxidase [Euryarchaeota archaeon]|nr:amino acid oxidase [Euryarchaeota archaeon]|tara:strand:+ start:3822 stop:4754 length:933 start_codon:yes stop_codon:yes gene_type:complete